METGLNKLINDRKEQMHERKIEGPGGRTATTADTLQDGFLSTGESALLLGAFITLAASMVSFITL